MRAVPPVSAIRSLGARALVLVAVVAVVLAAPAAAVTPALAAGSKGFTRPAHAAGQPVERDAVQDPSQILYQNTYPGSGNALNLAGTGWGHVQYPSDAGVPQPDRMQFGAAPGLPIDPFRPPTNVAHFQLNPFSGPDGDVTDIGGELTNRVEVYDRIATRGTPDTSWPDPVGSTRWYSFGIFVPANFPEDPNKWFDFTQWKGLNTGSPPLVLDITGSNFMMGGTKADQNLGYINRGAWNWFVIGIHFSASTTDGWMTIYRDGVPIVNQYPTAAMNSYWKNGVDVVDPDYLKMGIYRSTTWAVPQDIYLSPMTIGTTLQSVTTQNADAPLATRAEFWWAGS